MVYLSHGNYIPLMYLLFVVRDIHSHDELVCGYYVRANILFRLDERVVLDWLSFMCRFIVDSDFNLFLPANSRL